LAGASNVVWKELDALPRQAEGYPLKPAIHTISIHSRQLAEEVSTLSQLQYDALQKSSYLLMPRAEREAYDRRGHRIVELREVLAKNPSEDLAE
jgi:hypothetical protein